MISDTFGPHDVSDWNLSIRPVAGRYPKLELQHAGKSYIVMRL